MFCKGSGTSHKVSSISAHTWTVRPMSSPGPCMPHCLVVPSNLSKLCWSLRRNIKIIVSMITFQSCKILTYNCCTVFWCLVNLMDLLAKLAFVFHRLTGTLNTASVFLPLSSLLSRYTPKYFLHSVHVNPLDGNQCKECFPSTEQVEYWQNCWFTEVKWKINTKNTALNKKYQWIPVNRLTPTSLMSLSAPKLSMEGSKNKAETRWQSSLIQNWLTGQIMFF